MASDTKPTILNFAAHLAPLDNETSPIEKAIMYGWLTNNGIPTRSGRELTEALKGQQSTRSVFRLVA